MPLDRFAVVVEGPADLAGIDLDSQLVPAVMRDASTPDSLPLLAYTLRQLWEVYGEDHRLDLEEYRDKLGGLHGSIQRAADAALTELSPSAAELEALRMAFIPALVRVNEDGSFVKSQARWKDLPGDALPALERLVEKRLLVSHEEQGENVLEVVHDKLFAVWPKLSEWLRDDYDRLRAFRAFLTAAKDWNDAGRPEDRIVHRGTRLEAIEEVVGEARFSPTNEREGDYIAACQQLRTQERERMEAEERRERERLADEAAAARRLTRRTLIGAAVAVLLALVAIVLYWQAEAARAAADRERRVALSRQVLATAQSQASVNSECSLILALQAYELAAEIRNLDLAPFETEVRTALAQSQVLATYPASQLQFSDVSWDHEGKRVVFADLEGRVWLWSAEAGIKPTQLQGPTRARFVAWRSDSASIGIATRDGALQLWDTTKPAPIKEVGLGKGPGYRLQWDRTGRRALVWTKARGALVVDMETGAVQPVIGGTIAPRGYAWSPDGRWVATANDKGEVWLISPDERSYQASFKHPVSVHSIAWSPPDGTLIAVGLDNGQIWIWNIQTHQREQILDGHTNQVTGLEFSPDGKSLASASKDTTLRIWLWREKTWRSEKPITGHTAGLNTIRWAPDGKRLATAGQDGTIRIWSALTARSPLTVTREPGWTRSVAWSPDGTFLASTGDDARVILRVSKTGALQRLTGNSGQVTASSWSRRPVRLATADKDGRVIVREGGNDAPIRVIEIPGMDFVAVSISPDGKFVAAAALQKKKVLIWEVGSEREKNYLTIDDAMATALAFSPDGSRLALAVGETETVGLLDIKAKHIEKKLLQCLIPHKATWGLAWSPKGQYLAAASDDGTVHTWDATSGKKFPILQGHQGDVKGVAWSPTGERLATASLDGTVWLWQFPPSGSSPTVLKGHSSGVRGIAWSPDGQWLVTAGLDGTTRLFHTAPDDVLKLARMQRDIGLTMPERDVCLRLAMSSDVEERNARRAGRQDLPQE